MDARTIYYYWRIYRHYLSRHGLFDDSDTIGKRKTSYFLPGGILTKNLKDNDK